MAADSEERMTARQNRQITGQRDTTGRFVKGQSGNPGGRPRGLVKKIREETEDGEDLADFLLRVFRGEVDGVKLKDRIEAATWLADRGFGRPVQAMNIETFEIDLTRLTDEQLERIARGEHPAVVIGAAGQS
jgi:Family of unknown function (DUF5681)